MSESTVSYGTHGINLLLPPPAAGTGGALLMNNDQALSDAVDSRLSLTGGTLSGDLDLGGNQISNFSTLTYQISSGGGTLNNLGTIGFHTNFQLTNGSNNFNVINTNGNLTALKIDASNVVTTHNNTLDNGGNMQCGGFLAFGVGSSNLPFIQNDGSANLSIYGGTAGFVASFNSDSTTTIGGTMYVGGNLFVSGNEINCQSALTMYAGGQGIDFSGENLSDIASITVTGGSNSTIHGALFSAGNVLDDGSGNMTISGKVGISALPVTNALTVGGTVAATLFSGSGASLASLNGTNVTSGTVANARTTAVSTATASTIALRDANGDLTANGYAATQQTLTDSTSVAWNAASGANAVLTLGSSTPRTLNNPTNLQTGAYYVLILKQDGTGSIVITTWGSAYKFPNAVKPVLSTAVSAIDMLTFYYDGTNLYGVAQKAFG
jgi:hypothetical protein